MTKIHELLAVRRDLSDSASKVLTEQRKNFGGQSLFAGMNRTIKYRDDARAEENATETTPVAAVVGENLAYCARIAGRFWDVMFQIEKSNASAVADLVVDGQTLVKDAPTTWLLGMETKLGAFKDLLVNIPTLDLKQHWMPVEGSDRRIMAATPARTQRTEKVLDTLVKYEATPEHPAQVETYTRDVVVADIETTLLSGAISSAEKAAMIERCDKLIRAVRKARQRANDTQAVTDKVAKQLTDYIIGS